MRLAAEVSRLLGIKKRHPCESMEDCLLDEQDHFTAQPLPHDYSTGSTTNSLSTMMVALAMAKSFISEIAMDTEPGCKETYSPLLSLCVQDISPSSSLHRLSVF